MSGIIQLKGGTAEEWSTLNPILAEREVGLEMDTRMFKIGDGVTNYTDLNYATVLTATNATNDSNGNNIRTTYLHISGGTMSGTITGTGYITSGGTSSQFVKGDGTLDSNTYALSSVIGDINTILDNINGEVI